MRILDIVLTAGILFQSVYQALTSVFYPRGVVDIRRTRTLWQPDVGVERVPYLVLDRIKRAPKICAELGVKKACMQWLELPAVF